MVSFRELLTLIHEAWKKVYQYRKSRCSLHLDDKILTAWNGLMIAAFCRLYQISGTRKYLDAAKQADQFLQAHLWIDGMLYVSFRDGRQGAKEFLDDYAACLFAQLALYRATLNQIYLERAEHQLDFMAVSASQYPTGYSMFLLALLDHRDPPPKVTVVLADKSEAEHLSLTLPSEAAVTLREPGAGYPLKNGATTFYVCRGHSCLPPVNELPTL